MRRFQTTRRMNSWSRTEEATSVLDLQFSPDGSILAVSQNAPAVDIFDVRSGRNIAILTDVGIGANLYDGHDGQAIAFTPDGSFLVAIDRFSDKLSFFDVPSMEFSYSLDYRGLKNVLSIAISPSGDRIAIGQESWRRDQYVVQIRNLDNGNHLQTLKGPDGPITTLSFSPDGEGLIAGAIDNTLHLWRVSDGAQLGVVQDHTDKIYDLDFSPDSTLLAVAMKDRKARVWRVPDGRLIHKLGATSDFGSSYDYYIPGMYSLDFSSDGNILATGSDRAEGVKLWDVSSGALLDSYIFPHVLKLDFITDETIVVQSGMIGRTWNWGFGLFDFITEEKVQVPEYSGRETGLAISPQGNRVAASFADDQFTCRVDIWPVSGAEFSDPWKLLEVEDCPGSMVFSPREAYLALAYPGNDYEGKLPSLKLVDVADGSFRSEFVFRDAELGYPLGMVFSPDGEVLAVIRSQGLIQFFRMPDMVRISSHYIRISTIPLPESFLFDRSGILRFSPDGKLLALALSDGSVAIWGVVE